ncbi:LysE family translocator [Salipiger abyssi]|uniref:LysE family translocator n=1 Tax=Salipiger abyssi TaxID=1250539 RepID=UPI001A8FD340|nr:LysE family translocator [Salipiger abyssi]MBN9889241.1 LysE family translocator [Salipiger abyssi]
MAEMVLSLIVFLLPLAYSPGPANMVFAATGARFGPRATIPMSLGYHLATWAVTLAIGLGFAGAVGQMPLLLKALRWAGALYVLYLAWRLARAGASSAKAISGLSGMRDGALLLLLNPKAYVIIALMFAQFLGRAPLGQVAEVVLITTVFTLNNLLAFICWTVVGDRIAALFHSERAARRLNTGFALLLAGVALWILFG